MPRTEIIVIAFAVVVLCGDRGIAGFAKALGEFLRASDEIGAGFDVGHGLRNSFGRRVFEALTPDNKTAELHDPPPNKLPLWKYLLLSLLILAAFAIFLTVSKFI